MTRRLTRTKPLNLWAKPGMLVRYTSPESGRIHDGLVAYTRDKTLYVRFDPPVPGVVNPAPVPITCCIPINSVV